MNVKSEKSEWRALYRHKREALPAEERARRDRAICEVITASASYRYAKILLSYAPKSFEIDIYPIVATALREGKRVAFPRCEEGNLMTFRFVRSVDELSPGTYGIAEPSPDAPIYENAPATLCLVPGIVFGRGGHRLGYGKGYYDRFLHTFSGTAVGVVYRDFVLPDLPRGRLDFSVAALATETGILPCPSLS